MALHRFDITHLWNGTPADPSLHATMSVEPILDGVQIIASSALRGQERLPRAPEGARTDDLWNYDVVELFLVGDQGCYLEIELGAGGHWLVLSFDGIRHRSDEHTSLDPVTEYSRTRTHWRTSLLLPSTCLPEGICRANAFAYLGGRFLAFHPVPGKEPDFHQPDTYPIFHL